MNILTCLLPALAALLCQSPNPGTPDGNPAPHYAVVEFSADFMREEPDYAAELGCQALMGTVVELLDTSGYWVKIKSPDPYTAWVTEMGLVPMSGKEIRDYLEAPKYICTAPYSKIYEKPSLNSGIVSDLVMGDLVRIMYRQIVHESGRYKGYTEGRAVLEKKFVGVVLPSGRTGYVPAKDVDVFYKWAKNSYERLAKEDEIRKLLVSTALKFKGVPYLWGGTSIKGVDCSGLVRCVYLMNGILLRRNASQMARTGEDVEIFRNGEVVWDNLQAGDLIFWGRQATDSSAEKVTHVGMYIGDGRFIHSSEIVRVNSLDSTMDDYYRRVPLRARRIIGNVDKPEGGINSVWTSPLYFPAK